MLIKSKQKAMLGARGRCGLETPLPILQAGDAREHDMKRVRWIACACGMSITGKGEKERNVKLDYKKSNAGHKRV